MAFKRLLWVVVAVVVAIVTSRALQGENWVKRGPGDSGEALGGCGGPIEPMVTLAGRVMLVEGVAGARLSLQDFAGNVTWQGDEPTDSLGHFLLSAPQSLAANFRLVATGGTHQGQAQAEPLSLDVEALDAARPLLYVNGPTTLASLYRARHPERTVEQADQAVRTLLDLEPATRLGITLSMPWQSAFSHAALLEGWRASGNASLRQYLDGLVTRFEADSKPVPFRGAAPVAAQSAQLGAKKKKDKYWLAKALGEFIGEQIGGELFGWLYEFFLGLAGQGPNAELLHELDDLMSEVVRVKTAILGKIDENNLSVALGPISDAIADINDYRGAFTSYEEAYRANCVGGDARTAVQKQACARAIAAFQRMAKAITAPTGAMAHVRTISSHLVGGAGLGEGAIALLDTYLEGSLEFIPRTSERLDDALLYYQAYQALALKLYLQTRKLQLQGDLVPSLDGGEQLLTSDAGLVELLPDGGEADFLSLSNVAILQGYLKRQAEVREALRKNEVRTGTLRHRKTGLVFLQAPFSGLQRTYRKQPSIDVAHKACADLAASHAAGYSTWRLPTRGELEKAIDGAPMTNTAEGGIYAWLGSRGFAYEPTGDVTRGARAFTFPNTAYLSSTSDGIEYYKALWNDGISYACVQGEVDSLSNVLRCAEGHEPSAFGAWCVTFAE